MNRLPVLRILATVAAMVVGPSVQAQTTIFDLCASASSAHWSSDTTPTLVFGNYSPTTGGVSQGTNPCRVFMQPGQAQWVEGRYSVTLPTLLTTERLQFRATLTLQSNGSDPIEGIRGSLLLDANSQKYDLGSVSLLPNAPLEIPLFVDLTRFAGTDVALILRSETTGASDVLRWKELTIVRGNEAEVPSTVVVRDLDAEGLAHASWSSGFPAALTFGTIDSNKGYAVAFSGTLEDNTSGTGITTHPNWNSGAAQRYVEGIFSKIVLPHHYTDIQFETQVCFPSSLPSQQSTGADVTVSVLRHSERIASVTPVFSDPFWQVIEHKESYDNALTTLSMNLSAFRGDTIAIRIRVDAGDDPYFDRLTWIDPRVTARLPQQVFVRNHNTFADDAGQDRSGIVDAITVARNLPASEVYFDAGTYLLNGTLLLPWQAADTKSVDNMSFKGSRFLGGTKMLVTGAAEDALPSILDADRARNLAVSHLTVNYDPLPYTQGTLQATSVPGYDFRLVIDPGFRELDSPFFSQPGDHFFGVYHSPAADNLVPFGCTSDTEILGWSRVSAGIFDIRVSNKNGATAGLRFSYIRSGKPLFRNDNRSGVYLPDTNVLYDSITVHAGPKGCFNGVGVEKVVVRNCRVEIPPDDTTGRLISANGDAVHVQSCLAGPDVVNCVFERMNDDGFNNYALGAEFEPIGSNIHLLTGGNPVGVGDKLLRFRESEGRFMETWTVIAVPLVVPGDSHDVVVTGYNPNDPPPPLQPDMVFNTSMAGANYLVADCTMQKLRGRAIVSKASNGLICNNKMWDTSRHAIGLVNSVSFNEGPLATRVDIIDNEFVRCGRDDRHRDSDFSGVIRISIENSAFQLGQGLHQRDVAIVSNDFFRWPRHAIFAAKARSLVVQANQFVNIHAPGYVAPGGWRGLAFLDACQDVLFQQCTGQDPRNLGSQNHKLGKVFELNEVGQAQDISNGDYLVPNSTHPFMHNVPNYN